MDKIIPLTAEANFQKQSEKEAIEDYVNIFESSKDSTQNKLHNFVLASCLQFGSIPHLGMVWKCKEK